MCVCVKGTQATHRQTFFLPGRPAVKLHCYFTMLTGTHQGQDLSRRITVKKKTKTFSLSLSSWGLSPPWLLESVSKSVTDETSLQWAVQLEKEEKMSPVSLMAWFPTGCCIPAQVYFSSIHRSKEVIQKLQYSQYSADNRHQTNAHHLFILHIFSACLIENHTGWVHLWTFRGLWKPAKKKVF